MSGEKMMKSARAFKSLL